MHELHAKCTSIILNLSIPELLSIQRCWASLDELEHTPKDAPLKFLSSLAFSIPISARLDHLDESSSVAIQVWFPDGRVLTFDPQPSDIRPLTPGTHKLNHKLIISHGKWTDALMIELSVIRHHSLDIPSESQYMSLITKLIKRGEGQTSSSSHMITSDSIQSSSPHMVGSVLISDIIKLRILPQDTLARGYNVFGPT
uniref:Integrator complex subunit 4/Protein SIEL C-terminal Ig-like domain-containing protein n=1 Tax=Amphimedon queenslandica TaxID=400682 RepID=A0A1X7TJA7_AMPQE